MIRRNDFPIDGPGTESKVEVAKRNGRHLRGTVEEVLASDQNHFEHDDIQLLKFHGTYQQDNRDSRKGRRAEGKEKEHVFMVRTAIPGGMLTAQQYLVHDALCDLYGNASLRITSRQGLQMHGVIQSDLKRTISSINESLLTTFGACGDVRRNVMACPAPLFGEPYALIKRVAREIAIELAPRSRAYHEIWLDGEKQATTGPEEPFYGPTYLPRKFKTGIALQTDNSIDVFSMDVGFIAMVRNDSVEGFNVVVGGGMGLTHSKSDTYARLAEPFAFIAEADAVETAKTVASILRDYGNRSDRKHARLKYLIDEWGMERFREEFRRRSSVELLAYRPLPPMPVRDYLGRHPQGDGDWFYGVHVQNGRIEDRPGVQLKTALHDITYRYQPDITLTPQQNLLLTGLPEVVIPEIERILSEYGVAPAETLTPARRFSIACPALPTCGLALSEAERGMPAVLDQIEMELKKLGLQDEPISIRMTGCPNGCARPYTADIAFVGKGPDNYNVYVGGRLSGDRVVDLYAADVASSEFLPVLRPLLGDWAKHRGPGEGFGDFYQRVVQRRAPRKRITGDEKPTEQTIALRVLRC